jgi:NYN domain
MQPSGSWPQLFWGERLITNVYIDGFNLYYGALKNSSHKWLDIEKLCNNVLPKTPINKLMYFTARVVPRPSDPTQNVRQDTYFRALSTNPKVEIIFGHFLSHVVSMPVCDALGKPTGTYAKVLKTEEKGSDVNLATHLLSDAALGKYDQAIVISNDSDLLMPIRFCRTLFGKRVGILNPHQRQSQVLAREADFVRPIRPGAISASQFSPKLYDRIGEINKPASW